VRYRHRVLTVLATLSVLTYLDRVCISVAGPRIQADFSLNAQDWGFVTGAFTIAYALFEMPGGHLGDRFGARAMLTRIVLWWSAFTTLTGLVSKLWSLLLVRFCFGVGEAGVFPTVSPSLFAGFRP
jgi:MFS transporter, ACS family, glucarate transporter